MLLVLGSVAWMVACGSGGSGNNVPSSTITSVTVTCTPATIQSGQTSQCSATVTGTGSFSSAVTWSANAGTISAAGLFTAQVVATSTAVTITATSTQDATKSGTAIVTVTPAGTITSVTVACSPSTIQSSQTSQCSATVTGTGSFSSVVMWSASAGTISSSGLFTAQVVATSTPVTITATSTQDATKSGTAIVTVNPVQQANNVQPIVVDAGPPTVGAVDEPFTSVTVCVPNTTTCQTIDHILVDTGSSGLRLLSSAGGGELTIPLPPQNDSSGNPLAECLVFLDGFTWGNVAAADITIAGEQASSVRLQVIIPSTSSPAVGPNCSSQTTGPNEGNSVSALGANGILGVGLFQQDCGQACVSSPPPNAYYDCPSSGCNPTTVTLANQVSNPVIFFPSDNNGVLISLPAVPNGGLPTVNGTLIFGIGTQSNNALGSPPPFTPCR